MRRRSSCQRCGASRAEQNQKRRRVHVYRISRLCYRARGYLRLQNTHRGVQFGCRQEGSTLPQEQGRGEKGASSVCVPNLSGYPKFQGRTLSCLSVQLAIFKAYSVSESIVPH